MYKYKEVVLLIGQTAGMLGLLQAKATMGIVVSAVVVYDKRCEKLANMLGVTFFHSISDVEFGYYLRRCDAVVCVHGREVLPKTLTDSKPCVNVHPCLWKYKGSNPVGRCIEADEDSISVGCHFMTDKIDWGMVLKEVFIGRGGCDSVDGCYQLLYPLYCEVFYFIFSNLLGVYGDEKSLSVLWESVFKL